MRNNIYTKVIDSIKAPEAAVEKAIDIVTGLNEEDKNKIIKFEKSKRHAKTLKFSGMVAASIACILALAVVFSSNAPGGSGNSFALTVGAAEVGNNNEAIFCLGDGGMALSPDYNAHFILGFNASCVGENVQTIEYSVKNGYFSVSNDIDEITNKTEAESVNYRERYFSDYGFYTSYTVNYDNQPGFAENFARANSMGADICPISFCASTEFSSSNSVREYVNEYISDVQQYYDYRNAKNSEFFEKTLMNLITVEKKLLDLAFENMEITVTVTFDDGTHQVQKINPRSNELTADNEIASVRSGNFVFFQPPDIME